MNKQTKIPVLSTRKLAYCALLAALSVVLARMLIPMPNATARFSIEAVPIVLSGILFGPVAGAMVGFCADFVGALFSGYGFNPLFSVPPILYGISGGLFRFLLVKKVSIPRLTGVLLPPVVLGSLLWQSTALAFVYNSKGDFRTSLIYFLTTRSVQFAITLVLDVFVLYLLMRTGIFTRLGIWPPAKKQN